MRDVMNFGILGCGLIASTHAMAVEAIPGAALLGVADKAFDRAASFAAERGIRAYHSYEEMLLDPAIDAVCVCTPSCFHEEGAVAALRAGKHVVLEKPMALNCESADRIIAAADESGKCLTVISQYRFSDDVRQVRELVKNRAFGRITLCDLSMKYYRDDAYFTESAWHGRMAFEGGGALMNQGIHGVDLLEYVMGEVKSVSGLVRTLVHKIEVEDTAAAVLEFASGALGVITASTCVFPGFDRRLSIHGDRGYVILRDDVIETLYLDGKVVLESKPDPNAFQSANNPAIPDCSRHMTQIANLMDAAKGKAKLHIDGREGRRAIRLITEIYKSSSEQT